MKKGDVVVLNDIFSNKIKLPAMNADQLYAVLSAKIDLSKAAEEISSKADRFRMDTKPENVDEYNAKLADPVVREWYMKYNAMQQRLFDESFEGNLPAPCIDKDIFPEMIAGLTAGEAMIVMNNLVKK